MTSLERTDSDGSGARWLLRLGDKGQYSFCLVCWHLLLGALSCHIRSLTPLWQSCCEEAKLQERPHVGDLLCSPGLQVLPAHVPDVRVSEASGDLCPQPQSHSLSWSLSSWSPSVEPRHFPNWALSKSPTYRTLEHNKITVQSRYIWSRLLPKYSN